VAIRSFGSWVAVPAVEGRFALRAAFVAAAALALASCAAAPPRTAAKTEKSKEFFSVAEYGEASPRVVAANAPVPQGGGRYQIGKPYTVAGKTYKPDDDPLYSQVGLASWYGDAFHGRLTANGEVYDVAALTAAHPTMPLPSYARVTNLANKRSIIVRVNDRGPFAHGRLIDVSQSVASILDFKRAGTAKVKVDYVGPAHLDGRDQKMLMASYRAPGHGGDGMVLAMNEAPKPRAVRAVAKPRKNLPVDRFEVFDNTPAFDDRFEATPAVGNSDELAPLIMRTGFASSYAPPAEQAAGIAATEAMASQAVVQIGVFGDRGNAARVGTSFASFGKVIASDVPSGERTLRAVRVVVDGRRHAPESVIAKARALGLNDAFVMSR
jgi:rare lipoprotein A (peptidoglycan hydrolase)